MDSNLESEKRTNTFPAKDENKLVEKILIEQIRERDKKFEESEMKAAIVRGSVIGGMKFDTDKPDMSLLSSIAIEELAKVLSFGKVKYAAHNWRKGITTSRLIGACLRHIFSYLRGESKDSETGLSHIAHAMCCCMFIIELNVTHPQLDDRHVVEVPSQ